MESGEILVEINGKEIQARGTGFQGVGILLYDIMVLLSRFKCETSCLFVTSSVSWDEQNRNTLDLMGCQFGNGIPKLYDLSP